MAVVCGGGLILGGYAAAALVEPVVVVVVARKCSSDSIRFAFVSFSALVSWGSTIPCTVLYDKKHECLCVRDFTYYFV
jgi:hypothetical protein